MKSVIKYASAALLLLASTYSYSGTYYEAPLNSFSASASSAASAWCGKTSTCHAMCGYSTASGNGNEQHWYNRSSQNNDDCDNAGQPYPYGAIITVSFKSGSCPTQLPHEHSDGTCQANEQVTCTAGSDTITRFVSVHDAETSDLTKSNGCAYEFSGFDSNQCFYSPADELLGCNMQFTQTDSPATGTESDFSPTLDNGETDTRQNTKDTTKSNTPPSTAPDGTVTESSTETTTSTNGSGANVIPSDNSVTFHDSDGTTTVYTENKTTVTHPDGTITETINKDTATATGSTTTYTIDNSTGAVTSTTTTNTTNNHTQTVVNNYDANGNLTSSETTESGSGQDGDEGDPEKEGNCGAPDQPVCDVKLADNSDEFQQELNNIESEKQKLQAQKDAITAELGDTSNDYGLSSIANFNIETLVTNLLPIPQNAVCSGISTTFLDAKTFTFEPCERLIPLREVLAWVFFILTLYAVINIMLGRRLF